MYYGATPYDYCRALGLVLELFPEIDRVELEKELDKYV